jgi:hypothetical protein
VTVDLLIGGGPEGVVYIAGSNPLFTDPSVLVSEYSTGRIVSYEVNANGDPLTATRRVFMSGLTGAEGAAVDPLTGDFLFSTFGGGDRIVRISGFSAPSCAPGDFNCDSAVDAADYVVWRKSGGASSGYDRWRANFGTTASGTAANSSTASVPEPTAIGLSAVAWVVMLLGRAARLTK